jgi:hypothetical protein
MGVQTIPAAAAGGPGTYYPLTLSPRPAGAGTGTTFVIAYAVLPAGELAVGRQFRFKISYDAGNTEAMVSTRIGPAVPTTTNNTEITAAPSSSGVGAAGYGYVTEAFITCTAAGISGTVAGATHQATNSQAAGSVVVGETLAWITPGSTTVNTTVANYFACLMKSSTTVLQTIYGASMERIA